MVANTSADKISRRDFMKVSAAGTAAFLARSGKLFARGSDSLKIALIGCGRRGTGAAQDCIRSSPAVELVAMADVFKDKLDASLATLKKNLGDKVKVTPDRCFVGFDAYRKIMALDVDIVLLATPPHFRPAHLKAAVEADKHVFMEKPVAVDPVGIRSVLASAQLAERKKLAIVAGTQRRHQACYIEIVRRIHRGDIGRIVAAQCYWIGDYEYYKPVPRQDGWSDMEWQLRNWNYFTWLSGDHIVEQHVHNIDVINWVLQAHPEKVIGIGGRQQRTGPEFGHIYDHFTVEFEYPGGIRVSSMCRQMKGCTTRVCENIVGTKGTAWMAAWGAQPYIEGQNPYKYDGPAQNPYVQEHADLIKSIRSGEPLNEGRNVAESTMAAIMGRMSAYTGRALKWDWAMKASKLDLRPSKYEFGELPVPPVAVPGKTPLI